MDDNAAHYETKQAILEEAGLSHLVVNEPLTGITDGANKTFTTAYAPLSDMNDDDDVDVDDVTVLVNGQVVVPREMDADSGILYLQTAPPAGASVLCTYTYSSITDSYLERVREEAEAWVDDSMDAIDPTPYGQNNLPVPPTVRKLTRWYAAANLLTRDYGSSRDTDQTSKDGANKMKMAQAALDKYIAIGGMSGLSDVSAAPVDVAAYPSLFSMRGESFYQPYSADQLFSGDYGVEETEDGIVMTDPSSSFDPDAS